jgi:hypothetical protein
MESSIRAQLENIVAAGTPTYRETAQALLSGAVVWPDDEIKQFLDGFLNDPYLTRNV